MDSQPEPNPDPRTYRAAVRSNDLSRTRARSLRRDLTPPERLLWSRLKNQQLDGLRFRKQHPMGPYIADFYCHESRLVVEIDGPTHRDDQLIHDDRRDAWMHERGIRVLRVSGKELFRNLRGVLSTIARVANEHKNPFSPAKAGEVPERSEGGGGNQHPPAAPPPPPTGYAGHLPRQGGGGDPRQ